MSVRQSNNGEFNDMNPVMNDISRRRSTSSSETFPFQSAAIVESKMVGTNGEVKLSTYILHIDSHLSQHIINHL